jgi:hypothetical protein
MNIQRILTTTAAVLAIAAPVASARPAVDSGHAGRAAQVQTSNYATMATHHDQVSNAQWQRAQAQPETPLTADTPDTGGRFPLPLVAIAIGVTLGIVLLQFVGKQVFGGRRRRVVV